MIGGRKSGTDHRTGLSGAPGRGLGVASGSALDAEKARSDALLSELVTRTAPQPLALHRVGIDTASSR